jgi:hypothetical protein
LIPNSSRVAATVTAPVHALHRHGDRDALRRETALLAQSLRLGQECHFGISCSSRRTTGCNSSSSGIFGTVVAIGSAVFASLGAQIDHSAIRSMTAIKHAFTIQETNLLTLAARGQMMILLALRYWTQMEQKRERSLAHTERTACVCVCVCLDVCYVQSNAWQKRSQICFTFKGRKPLRQLYNYPEANRVSTHTMQRVVVVVDSGSVALLCTSKESKRDTLKVACVRVFDLEHRHGSNGILQTRHDSFHE